MKYLAVLGLLFIIGLSLVLKTSIPVEIARETIRSHLIGDQRLLSDPLSSDYFAVSGVTPEKPFEIPLQFDQPQSVSGLSIFFPGNLETDSSFVPQNFDIYYQKPGQRWTLVSQKTNYFKSSYRLDLTENFPISGLKIVLKKSDHEGGEVRLSDLKLYSAKKVSLLEYFFWYAHTHNKSLPAYLLYSLIFYFLLLLPGFVFAGLFIKNHPPHKSELALVAGPLISFLLLGISTTLFILSKKPIFLWLILPYFVVGIVIFFRQKSYRTLSRLKLLIFIPLIFILAASLLQIIRDTLFNLNYFEPYIDKQAFVPVFGYFGYHADNYLPWGIARSLLHNVSVFSDTALKYRLGLSPNSVFDRTPLFSLMVTPILAIFGESHFIFQKFANVLVSFYYLAIYYTINTIFTKNVAKLSTLLILLSVPLSLTTFNAEVNIKSVAMYPLVLAAGIFYSRLEKRFLWTTVLLMIAIFTHPMVVLFLPAFALIYFFQIKPFKKALLSSALCCSAVIAVLATWIIFGNSQKTNLQPNIYTALSLSSLTWTNKAANIINIFLPDYLHQYFSTFISKEYALYFFRYSLFGSISPLFVYYLFRRLRVATAHRYLPVLILGFIPQVLFWLHPHGYDGASFSLMFPFTSVFLLGIVVFGLTRESNRLRSQYLKTFILFMIASLYFESGAFPGLRYWDKTITWYSFAVVGLFLSVSWYLLKLSDKTTER